MSILTHRALRPQPARQGRRAGFPDQEGIVIVTGGKVMISQFEKDALAGGERKVHEQHDCLAHGCPIAPCAIHGVAGEDCDENCLFATRPELFK